MPKNKEEDNFNDYLIESKQIFQGSFNKIENRPNPNREFQDICCYLTLVILMFSFYGYGAYAIHTVFTTNSFSVTSTPTLAYASFANYMSSSTWQTFLGYTIAMVSLSLTIGVGLLLFIKSFPKESLIIMALITFISLVVMGSLSFKYGNTSAGIVIFVFLFVLSLLLCIYYDQLPGMIAVLKTVAIFITSRGIVLLITTMGIIWSLGKSIVWMTSYYSFIVMYNQNLISGNSLMALTVYWVFCGFFFTFFLFYLMVYMISSECALWFYKSPLIPIITSIKWLIKNLGSLTFAAFLLSLIKTAELMIAMARTRDNDNVVVAIIGQCFLCMISCCLRRLQYYIKILNNYCIIICAVTGDSYLESTSISAYIILTHIDMFNLFTIISYFIRFSGTLTCVVFPTLISLVLFNSLPVTRSMVIIGTSLVFFLSSLVSIVLLSTFVEAMNSMFVFYSLESQIGQFGKRVNEINQHQQALEQAYQESFSQQFNRVKLPRTQQIIINNNQVTIINETSNAGINLNHKPNNAVYPHSDKF